MAETLPRHISLTPILSERPMPYSSFSGHAQAQTGKPIYSVVDGQQRLRAIFEFMDDRFALTQSKDRGGRGKQYSRLPRTLRENLRINYDLTVEELTGYSDDDIRDIFVRMNKYVVKLSPAGDSACTRTRQFYELSVEGLATLPFSEKQRVFTKHQVARMKPAEFSAELSVLLIEGPQDKKASLNITR